MSSRPEHPHASPARRHELREGQRPPAAILACSDSRVPAEVLFDVGLGDIFVIRTAGHCLDRAVEGSVQYAVEGLGVGLVVVLGHESCGAVGAALQAMSGGGIPGGAQRVFVEQIAPSILAAPGRTDEARLVEEAHAEVTAQRLVEDIPAVAARLRAGTLGVVAARYRLSDGRVEAVSSRGVDV